MEQVQFRGSMKNVPQCNEREYIMKLTHATEALIWRLRWFAAFYLGIVEMPDEDFETFQPYSANYAKQMVEGGPK